jgi:hypothetical protein
MRTLRAMASALVAAAPSTIGHHGDWAGAQLTCS